MKLRLRLAAFLYLSEHLYARLIRRPNWFIRRQFDRWARWNLGPQMEQDHGSITEKALERMGLVQDDRVLDLGCGTGWAARRMASRLRGTGRVVGVDLSQEMIHIAQSENRGRPNLQFMTGSAEQLPFPPECFDKILSVETLYFCPDQRAVLRELLRIMAHGGVLLLVVCLHKENPASLSWVKELNLPVHVHGASEYRSMLESEGWTGVEAEILESPSEPGSPPSSHDRALLLKAQKP